MGRAARRQQERASRRQPSPTRARGLPVATSAPVPAGQRVSAVWWKPRWVTDIVSELRKVTWPTWHETRDLTVVVIVISLLFALVLGGADFTFSWIVKQTILR